MAKESRGGTTETSWLVIPSNLNPRFPETGLGYQKNACDRLFPVLIQLLAHHLFNID